MVFNETKIPMHTMDRKTACKTHSSCCSVRKTCIFLTLSIALLLLVACFCFFIEVKTKRDTEKVLALLAEQKLQVNQRPYVLTEHNDLP